MQHRSCDFSKLINPFKPNVISHRYQLEQSISVLRDVEWHFSFLFKFQKKLLQANRGDPDHTPRSLASGLGLHCLPMSHKKDAMLLWVKIDIGVLYNWTATYENLSSGFPIRSYSNQPAQQQSLARKVKFRLDQVLI